MFEFGTPKEVRDHFISKLAPLSTHLRFVTHLLVQSETEKQEMRQFLVGLHETGDAHPSFRSLSPLRPPDFRNRWILERLLALNLERA